MVKILTIDGETIKTLNNIPNGKISEDVVTKDNKTGSLGLKTLGNPDIFKLLENTVLTLCQQIDSKGVLN